MVFLCWLQSQKHLEGTEYSLPVNRAMTALSWNLIYELFNLP